MGAYLVRAVCSFSSSSGPTELRFLRPGCDSVFAYSVGKINPNESDAIQAFRRAVRKDGLTLNTERSYVSKLKTFMHGGRKRCPVP